MIMAGGTASLDEMIKGTQRGILVTKLWYIREVDPQTLLLTGLTRDGTFFIENGKIKHPVKNFASTKARSSCSTTWRRWASPNGY
jgi:predicted Zn-dependent protease